MNMKRLQRKADTFLSDWKKREHKPLIVSGARQVGKTECIREFGKSYESFIEINFKLKPIYKNVVLNTGSYEADDIIKEITNIDPSKRFIPGKTLLFFDEVQSFPDICTSLKSFCENNKYDVICAGSLLGLNYSSISSIAVGYQEEYQMHGLDFEEFLLAKGYSSNIKDELLDYMKNAKSIPDSLYISLRNLFYDFVVLGGMPEVVFSYIKNSNFSGTQTIQHEIIDGYRKDMQQYADGLDKTKIQLVFDAIPAQLAKSNPKFMISKIRPHARGREFEGVKEWLTDSGIILISRGLNFPELPLKGNVLIDNYRLYFADTGLLIASLDEESQEDLRANRNLGVYKGAIYENLVADAFVKEGLPLYFYKRTDGTLEEDFFARTKNNIVPIEVKSRGGHSKSLRTLIDYEKYPDVAFGVKLADSNITYQDNIYILPHFLTFLIKDWLKSM